MMRHNGFRAGRGCLAFLVMFAVLQGLASICLCAAAALQGEVDVSPEATPEIRQIKPEQAAASSEVTIEIKGRNFSRGAYVSFSHPAVHVISTRRAGATRLESKLAIAKKAPSGTISLYVSNPAGAVAEAPFTITGGTTPAPAPAAPVPAATPPAPPQSPGAGAPRFEVLNLGEGIEILQSLNKPRGILRLAAGKLIYEEAGKEVFSALPAEIKEIEVNAILGVNTGTFHVILKSGKTFNFAPASLRPADSQAIMDSIRQALK